MVESWWEVCILSFCCITRALSCMVVVVNHIPCDNVKLDKLSKSFMVWAAVVLCQLEFVCATGSGLSDWAVVVTMVGSCVSIIKLYKGKSLSAHLISVLLAWRT